MRWFFLLFAMTINSAASVFLKLGSKYAEANPLADGAGLVDKVFHFLNAWTIVAIVMFALNVLAYRKALDGFNLSIANPIMVSGGVVLVATAAWLIPALSERLCWWQVLGIGMIVAGIWLVVYTPARAVSTH